MQILYPVIVLAILGSSCEWTGTNPAYTSAELAHHFTKSRTRYVITDRAYLDAVTSAIDLSEQDVQVILFTDILSERPVEENGCRENRARSFRTLHDLLTADDETTLRKRLQAISIDSPATVMSTSGTTGLPKMIQRSHRSLVMETRLIGADHFEKPYQVRRLYCTAMFHAYSFPEMVINTLRLGIPSYYMRRFDATFARKVRMFGVTETFTVPAILLRITELAEEDALERLHLQSLRTVFCAAAPLTSHLRGSFLKLLDDRSARVVQGWGMTEAGWVTKFFYPEHDDTGSVGRMLPGYEICVDTMSRVQIPSGQQAGELLVKGLQQTTKYKESLDGAEEGFDDEWLRTGDVGYVENGKVYLMDRAKDIIKVNGWAVSSAELEAVLHEMPAILDAAALSCGTSTDEHAAIFVVARDSALSEADIMRHLLDRVARFKVATSEIHLVTSIPRNASGKILRNALRKKLEVNER